MPESDQNARCSGREVEERLESLACMAFGMTHEFNNILAAVLNNAEALRGQLPPDSTVRPYADRIESNTRTAIALTKRIQMFTEDGAAICETVRLSDLVAQVLTAIHSDIPAGSRLHAEALDESCTALVIPHLLRESATALIQNAVESFTEKGGEVHIRVYRALHTDRPEGGVTLGELPTSSCSVLEVSDNGIGIPPTALNRIFDPFFTTRMRARGLGLIPVVGLVKSCNVAVHVESSVDRGTTVRLYFGEPDKKSNRAVPNAECGVKPTPIL
jgi:two-component system, cell cycle sensor histidine kinase and response regulator CckA